MCKGWLRRNFRDQVAYQYATLATTQKSRCATYHPLAIGDRDRDHATLRRGPGVDIAGSATRSLRSLAGFAKRNLQVCMTSFWKAVAAWAPSSK